MTQMPESRSYDRREFLKLVAAVGAASTLPAVAAAQATPPPAGGTPPAAATPAAPEAPKGPSEDAKALAALLDRRYPGRFAPEQRDLIADDVDGDLAGGKRLRATKLANGDEPDFAFRP